MTDESESQPNEQHDDNFFGDLNDAISKKFAQAY